MMLGWSARTPNGSNTPNSNMIGNLFIIVSFPAVNFLAIISKPFSRQIFQQVDKLRWRVAKRQRQSDESRYGEAMTCRFRLPISFLGIEEFAVATQPALFFPM